MTHVPPISNRRRVLGGLIGLPFMAAAGRANALRTSAATTAELAAPDSATMLVAGPEGGMLDRWSRVLAPLLARALPLEAGLRRRAVGAPDGVTGANQFGARVAPDGQTLMLAPGDAALAWLVSDPRAQYDIARWVPVLATLSSAVVFLRAGAPPSGQVRLASTGSAGADLPAMLGLEMLGWQVELLDGPPGEGRPGETRLGEARLGAIARGSLDAVLIRGHKVEDQARALLAAGARPLFALGTPGQTGGLTRSALFPDVPTFTELFALAQVGGGAGGPGRGPAIDPGRGPAINPDPGTGDRPDPGTAGGAAVRWVVRDRHRGADGVRARPAGTHASRHGRVVAAGGHRDGKHARLAGGGSGERPSDAQRRRDGRRRDSNGGRPARPGIGAAMAGWSRRPTPILIA